MTRGYNTKLRTNLHFLHMKTNRFFMVWAIMACCFVATGCDDDGVDSDESNQQLIENAKKLTENTFMIVSKSGKQTYNFADSLEWTYETIDDRTYIYYEIRLSESEFSHKNDGGYLLIPDEILGKSTVIDEHFLTDYPDFGAVFVFGEIMAEYAQYWDGMHMNLNVDGKSMFLLEEVDETKGYSGRYRLLFALTFVNEADGIEYTVYAKLCAKKHNPVLNYFSLKPESDFVKVGDRVVVNLERTWEEGAPWDWNDVEIVAQYDYENRHLYIDDNGVEADMGFFSWDAASHTLTSLKSNDNKSVFVRFALKSNPSSRFGFTICTGEGWGFKSFTVEPAEQSVTPDYESEQYRLTPYYAECQFSVTSWTPTDIDWNPEAIEVDPESDPNNFFLYNRYDGSLHLGDVSPMRRKVAPGQYEIRIRLRENHDIGVKMKITVTE